VVTKNQNAEPPRLRRAYFDCRYGQLHVHNAIPAGGGFDELTTVICIPALGESARVFVPTLQALGYLRSVYAVDLPGGGESDPAPGVTAVAAGEHAVTDFVQSMRIRSFDLIAYSSGVDVALAVLKSQAPLVRRAVLIGDRNAALGLGDKVSVWPTEDLASETFTKKLATALGKAV
jgi:pimeloyl-ACP methyl ester carboxylesterase